MNGADLPDSADAEDIDLQIADNNSVAKMPQDDQSEEDYDEEEEYDDEEDDDEGYKTANEIQQPQVARGENY